MKTVNSLSGGKTSSYIAVHFPADYDIFSLVCIDDIRCKPKDPGIIQYVNAKLDRGGYIERYGEFIATAENDLTIYAMRDLEQLIGREIVWVRGRSFDDVIDNGGLKGKLSRLPSKQFRICTEVMKLLPIFMYWFNHIGVKVNMRIGFRFDEFNRIENFFNGPNNPNSFKIPVSCKLTGQKLQKWEEFIFRACSFPLAKAGIVNQYIVDWWEKNGFVGGGLFEPRRKIIFPKYSNCINCFHKKPETLAVEATESPLKMQWAADQEHKGLGTWLEGLVLDDLIEHAKQTPYSEEMFDFIGSSCDSGGCTD